MKEETQGDRDDALEITALLIDKCVYIEREKEDNYLVSKEDMEREIFFLWKYHYVLNSAK